MRRDAEYEKEGKRRERERKGEKHIPAIVFLFFISCHGWLVMKSIEFVILLPQTGDGPVTNLYRVGGCVYAIGGYIAYGEGERYIFANER